MKTYSLLFLLASPAFALECPKLTGTYFCTFPDSSFSPLKIEQALSDSSDERVSYKMSYTRFNTGTDEFDATPIGVSDELGWINKCSNNKILSLSGDGSMLGEITLNREQAYVRKLNGVVAQTCPRISN